MLALLGRRVWGFFFFLILLTMQLEELNLLLSQTMSEISEDILQDMQNSLLHSVQEALRYCRIIFNKL